MKVNVQELRVLGETYIMVAIDNGKVLTFRNDLGSVYLELLYDAFDIFEKYPIIGKMIAKYKDNKTSLTKIKEEFEALANSSVK